MTLHHVIRWHRPSPVPHENAFSTGVFVILLFTSLTGFGNANHVPIIRVVFHGEHPTVNRFNVRNRFGVRFRVRTALAKTVVHEGILATLASSTVMTGSNHMISSVVSGAVSS